MDHGERNRLEKEFNSVDQRDSSQLTNGFFHTQQVVFFHFIGQRMNEGIPAFPKIVRKTGECVLNAIFIQFSHVFSIDAIVNVEMVTLE